MADKCRPQVGTCFLPTSYFRKRNMGKFVFLRDLGRTLVHDHGRRDGPHPSQTSEERQFAVLCYIAWLIYEDSSEQGRRKKWEAHNWELRQDVMAWLRRFDPPPPTNVFTRVVNDLVDRFRRDVELAVRYQWDTSMFGDPKLTLPFSVGSMRSKVHKDYAAWKAKRPKLRKEPDADRPHTVD